VVRERFWGELVVVRGWFRHGLSLILYDFGMIRANLCDGSARPVLAKVAGRFAKRVPNKNAKKIILRTPVLRTPLIFADKVNKNQNR